ncbi:MAG: hypothetical protein OSA97_05740 [Nevskia sp.]|nr:hypothetical protein [Nevskia sp.]
MPEIPDLEWYSRRSIERGVGIRCPFATVHTCFRHYDSVSLMGQAGATPIPEKEDKKLLKKWKDSGLYPVTDEQSTSIWGGEKGNPGAYSNFCPEVTLEFFGTAASYLSRYADEIDRDAAHRSLSVAKAPHADPRWRWQSVTPMHYTDCQVYSVLLHASKSGPLATASPPPSRWARYAEYAGKFAGALAAIWKAIKAFGF